MGYADGDRVGGTDGELLGIVDGVYDGWTLGAWILGAEVDGTKVGVALQGR